MTTHPARDGESRVSGPPVDGVREAELLLLFRSFGASATLVWTAGGVILEGVSPTYYGKQMAQEITRAADLVVVANRIRVLSSSTARVPPPSPS